MNIHTFCPFNILSWNIDIVFRWLKRNTIFFEAPWLGGVGGSVLQYIYPTRFFLVMIDPIVVRTSFTESIVLTGILLRWSWAWLLVDFLFVIFGCLCWIIERPVSGDGGVFWWRLGYCSMLWSWHPALLATATSTYCLSKQKRDAVSLCDWMFWCITCCTKSCYWATFQFCCYFSCLLLQGRPR